VEFLLKWFDPKARDFIFLVDENVPFPPRMEDGETSLLQHIFLHHIEDTDRVSLVKYGKSFHTKIVFSLCEKQLNIQQLENQLKQQETHQSFNDDSLDTRSPTIRFSKAI